MSQKSERKNALIERYRPLYRRLRGYAFDPSLSTRLESADVNLAIFKVDWEEDLEPGPIGEYLEIIDIDPASRAFYEPVNLNHQYILALDGLPPSESNPQFHQQMVYAVAMTTIQHFEKSLGRKVQWSSIDYKKEKDNYVPERFVQRLRIYPHAIREANAFYSPQKKAILFGYFTASPSDETTIMPGSLVFTCLSHDIIAHEVTHALIDGQHKQYVRSLTKDTLAIHEAFSDIVALFQHFTFPEVLKNQIAKTRGELESQHLLGELAQQLGLAIGNYGSLRSALGQKNAGTGKWELTKPNPEAYKKVIEPHDRGAILVAAVFRAFLKIYKRRTNDLFRIATNGTGVLPEGDIHPDLVNRLASEAAMSAKHVLSMCIRSLDYCPPVRVTFGDYLRAIITADHDLIADDDFDYRLAFIEAFKEWGVYPKNIFSLSEESLLYRILNRTEIDTYLKKDKSFRKIAFELKKYYRIVSKEKNREDVFKETIESKRRIHEKIRTLMIEVNEDRIELKRESETDSDELSEITFKLQKDKMDIEERSLTVDFDYKKKKLELERALQDLAFEFRGREKNRNFKKRSEKIENELKELKEQYDSEKQEIEKDKKEAEIDFKNKAAHKVNVKKKLQILEDLSGFIVPLFDVGSEDFMKNLFIDECDAPVATKFNGKKFEGFLGHKYFKEEVRADDRPFIKVGNKQYDAYIKINKKIYDEGPDTYYPNFQVYNLQFAERVGPDGIVNRQLILSILQDLFLLEKPAADSKIDFGFINNNSLVFRGGSTLIIDAGSNQVKFGIVKKVFDLKEITEFIELETNENAGSAPFAINDGGHEPFAILHRGHTH
ncbi:MAG: hypothetical protein MUF45_05325 [Spirosomaceae bacterium]|nr:hypothetical protein [Spirosomataceae bacterium]